MTGLPPYSIKKTESFVRSFKKLAKSYRKEAIDILIAAIEGLISNPFPSKSRDEILPAKTPLPENWTFHKLEIWLGKGASGQIRLMYLVNEDVMEIRLLLIYSHEQYAKRPADRDIRDVIDEALNKE